MDTPEDNSGRTIVQSQLNFIDKMSYDHKVNALALLRATAKKEGVKSVKEIPYTVAIKVINFLNQVQLGVKPLPEAFAGYDPNWQKQVSHD